MSEQPPVTGPIPIAYVSTHGLQPMHAALTLGGAQGEALKAEKQADSRRYDYQWYEQKPGVWWLMRKPRSKRLVPAERTARTVVAVPLAETPVPGPIPIYVKPIPAGAQLDLSALTAHVVGDVLDALLDQSTGLLDLLHEVADPPKRADGDTEPLDRERLEEELAERASKLVPVYGPQVTRLAAELLRAAGQHIPKQRGRAA